MTNETKPVLLTEAEWHALLGLAYKHAEPTLRQRGLIAPEPVDALLIEAREIVIATTPQPQRNFDMRKAEIRRGWKDDGFCVQIALAALRRGMELAKPELTREQLSDAIVKVFGEGERGFAGVTPNNITALHAALTEGQSK